MFEREKIKRIASIFKYTSKTFEGRSAFFGIRFFYDLNSYNISCTISYIYISLFLVVSSGFPPLEAFFIIVIIIFFFKLFLIIRSWRSIFVVWWNDSKFWQINLTVWIDWHRFDSLTKSNQLLSSQSDDHWLISQIKSLTQNVCNTSWWNYCKFCNNQICKRNHMIHVCINNLSSGFFTWIF